MRRASQKCLKFYPIAYALALCARDKRKKVSKLAYEALPDICRKPTQLFQFLSFCRTRFNCRGWPRSHRKAIAAWYTENQQYRNNPRKLALHVTKYKRRHMLSQKRVIKACHPKPPDKTFSYIFRFVTKGIEKADEINADEKDFEIVKGYISAVNSIKKKHKRGEMEDIIEAIHKWKVPWEVIPTKQLKEPEIWRALLHQKMPMTAMIRNLGRMSRLELFKPKSREEQIVCNRLRTVDSLESTHPIQLLGAFAAYRRGRGLRDDSMHTWEVNREIERALLDSYHLSSARHSERMQSKVLIAIDVKMEMDFHTLGIPSMSCKEAAIALSLLFGSIFEVETISFYKSARTVSLDQPSGELFDTDFSDNHSDHGETNYDVPFRYAEEKKFEILLLLTDTLETKEIDKIRRSFRKMKQSNTARYKKCVVVCFKNSRPASEPGNNSMLDVVGVDEHAVEVIKDFIQDYQKEMRDITGGQSIESMMVDN